MKNAHHAVSLLAVFLLSSLVAFPSVSRATEFDALVVPSLMDSEMDGWYKIPPDSGPRIHRASRVYQGQMFNLLIFFRGYAADHEGNLHVRYDVQVYDPQGEPTDDTGTDILAYQGPAGNPQALMLNQQYLKIVFTDRYPPGTYTIKVTAYDRISGNTFTSETPIELIPFSMPKKFASPQEAGQWMMGYYRSPTPVKAISAVQSVVDLDPEWLDRNVNLLTFFRRIFSDNPFLFQNLANHLDALPPEEQKKFLLVAAISGDSELEAVLTANGDAALQQFYDSAQARHIPDVEGVIDSAVQLDILWSEFLSTGKYDPIRKIVSALALKKYQGTLERIKAGEIEVTKAVEREAYFEATYRSAVWSLISNCRQMPLVYKYCAYMVDNEPLGKDIKRQLGTVLHIAREEMQKKEKTKGDPS
jgi:hypothetical protein